MPFARLFSPEYYAIYDKHPLPEELREPHAGKQKLSIDGE